MSVLSARHPAYVRTSVLAAPTSSARAVRSSANRSAANLPGIVTETPTHSGPKPAYQGGQFVGRAFDAVISPAVQTQRPVGRQMQLR